MIVYFLRGLPGAGKTTLARDLAALMCIGVAEEHRRDIVCHVEADKWMVNEKGEYDFDWRRLAEVHAACQAEYRKALDNKVPCIIVSNTSVDQPAIDAYQSIADEAGYQFVSLVVENRHGNKSVHNVPDKSMENMRRKFHISL